MCTCCTRNLLKMHTPSSSLRHLPLQHVSTVLLYPRRFAHAFAASWSSFFKRVSWKAITSTSWLSIKSMIKSIFPRTVGTFMVPIVSLVSCALVGSIVPSLASQNSSVPNCVCASPLKLPMLTCPFLHQARHRLCSSLLGLLLSSTRSCSSWPHVHCDRRKSSLSFGHLLSYLLYLYWPTCRLIRATHCWLPRLSPAVSRVEFQENRAFGSVPVEDIRSSSCENNHRTATLKISAAAATSSADLQAPSTVSSSRYTPKMPHFSGVACGRSPSHFDSNFCGVFRINVTTLALIMLCAAFIAHCSNAWEMSWKRQFLLPGFWTSRKPLVIGTPCTATFFVGSPCSCTGLICLSPCSSTFDGCSTGWCHALGCLHSSLLKVIPVCATFLMTVLAPSRGNVAGVTAWISRKSLPSTVAFTTQFVDSFLLNISRANMPAFSKISMSRNSFHSLGTPLTCHVRLQLAVFLGCLTRTPICLFTIHLTGGGFLHASGYSSSDLSGSANHPSLPDAATSPSMAATSIRITPVMIGFPLPLNDLCPAPKIMDAPHDLKAEVPKTPLLNHLRRSFARLMSTFGRNYKNLEVKKNFSPFLRNTWDVVFLCKNKTSKKKVLSTCRHASTLSSSVLERNCIIQRSPQP